MPVEQLRRRQYLTEQCATFHYFREHEMSADEKLKETRINKRERIEMKYLSRQRKQMWEKYGIRIKANNFINVNSNKE